MEELQKTDIEIARNHIERNIVEVTSGRKCVDGRYLPNQAVGRLAKPGADLGYVMAFLALNRQKNLGLSASDCFDLIYNILTENGDSFYIHSDSHALEADEHHSLNGGGNIHFGCGHFAKAMMEQYAAMYGVEPDEMVEVFRHMRKRQKMGARIEEEILDGNHNERGVLVVEGTKRTIRSFDGENMYFIYDATRDRELTEKAIKKINEKRRGLNIDINDFSEVSNGQLNATLSILAKDKPIFLVNADEEIPQVKFSGSVE